MIGIDSTFLVHVEVADLPENTRASEWLQRTVLQGGERLALAPQVLTEFIHIVTDARRFRAPLSVEVAVERAAAWWQASEVDQVFPTSAATDQCLNWLRQHRLGRKRLLDTQLAATYLTAGIRRIVTSNARDYAIFGDFDLIVP